MTRRHPTQGRAPAVALLLAIIVGSGTAIAGPVWVLGGVVALILAVITYLAPGCLLAAYLAIPFFKGTLQQFSPVDLTVLLAVLNAVQVVVLLRKHPFHRRMALALWLALAVMILVGTSYATNGAVALNLALSWIALVSLPLLAAIRVAADPRALRQFVLTLGTLSVIFIVGGMIGLLGSHDGARLGVLDADTIGVARAAVLLPVLGVAYLTTTGHTMTKWLVLALSPAAIVVGIASGSRGPVLFALVLLGAVVVSSALLDRSNVRRTLGIVVFGILGFAAVAITIPSLPALSLVRFDNLFAFLADSGGGPDTSAAARLTLFDIAWRMFMTQPIIGWGTGGFASVTALDSSLAGYAYPHNSFLQVLAEFGVIGLGVVGSLLLVALRPQLPNDPGWRAIRYVFIFWTLNALVSGDIYGDRMFWGLLLLLAFQPIELSRARDP